MKPRRFASATTFSISWSRGTVTLARYSPPRRARCAGWPTSPHGGEAKCKLDAPHPASLLRGLADLPTWWGGEMQTRYSPPGEPAARAGRPRHTVGRRNASSMLPTRRARCAGWPTSPHGGEAKCKLDTPHPASPLRGLADLPTRWGGECKLDTPHPASPLHGPADLPTWWGGEMQARYSPPGEPAARAGRPPHTVGRRMQARYSPPGAAAPRPGRPPHTVGRRNASSILPTRRARCAGWPTSPHGGEAKCKLDTPHPSSPLRGLADLPTRWGGGEMQARYSPPGEPAARAGRPPHTVGRRKSQSGSPLLKD